MPDKARIIAIANQKGGVGKTTTAINLATALCAVGKRVLLVDFDPQGNATTGLGIRNHSPETSVYHLILEKSSFASVMSDTPIENLKILPANMHLAAAEIELPTLEKGVYALSACLKENASNFDYILIDCPPSLSFLTINALSAANSLLIPLQCEYYALEGLSHLLNTISRVRNTYNQTLDIEGILLTMFDIRNKLSSQVAQDVRKHLDKKVFETVIPRNVRVSEAPSHGLPVLLYDLKSTGASAYVRLAAELLSRETTPANV